MKDTVTIGIEEYLELLKFKESFQRDELAFQFLDNYSPRETSKFLFLNHSNYKDELLVLFSGIESKNRELAVELDKNRQSKILLELELMESKSKIDTLNEDLLKLYQQKPFLYRCFNHLFFWK